MKPLLIGEAPSKNERPPTPLEGRIGRRMAAWAGLSFEEFLERFDRVNLLEVRQDTKEKGFEFDMVAARERARVVRIEPERTVVLLGKRVADAFGFVKPYFEAANLAGSITMYVVPHPSGVNRWWNDPVNVEKMEKFMRALLVKNCVIYHRHGDAPDCLGLAHFCATHETMFFAPDQCPAGRWAAMKNV